MNQASFPLRRVLLLPVVLFIQPLGDITFSGVSFSYPTRPEQLVLRDFSFRVPAGKMVALVGESGGGKSTVTALLERFYDVSSGSIEIDGVDIECYDPSWLRGSAIGLINQVMLVVHSSMAMMVKIVDIYY